MSSPANTGATALLMGSSRLFRGVCRQRQELAKPLQNSCNHVQRAASDPVSSPSGPMRSGTVRDQARRAFREQP